MSQDDQMPINWTNETIWLAVDHMLQQAAEFKWVDLLGALDQLAGITLDANLRELEVIAKMEMNRRETLLGVMWFDDDPKKTLEDKITQAGQYYQRKLGKAPTRCEVNTATLDGDGEILVVNGITVEIHPSILPGHFFITGGDQ